MPASGSRRTRSSSIKQSAKKQNFESSHAVTSECCEGKQNGRSRKRNEIIDNNDAAVMKAISKAKATFEEDENIVEIETEGQATDFVSDNTESSEDESGKCTMVETGSRFINVDSEITFKQQVNNNANLIQDPESCLNESLEEGECSQRSGVDNAEGEETGDDTMLQTAIDRKIDASMSKVQQFLEQKFQDMSKMMELERQLAENKCKLEDLKSKGRYCLPDGDKETHSELMIYHNVVNKKRGSSSSEYEIGFINSSDENLDNSILYPIERELQKKCSREIRLSDKDQQEASTSSQRPVNGLNEVGGGVQKQLTMNREVATEKASNLVREAEASRAHIYEVKGKDGLFTQDMVTCGLQQLRANCATSPLRGEQANVGLIGVDADYLLVAAHVDEATQIKIINQEYVDFAKLLRKDKEEDFS